MIFYEKKIENDLSPTAAATRMTRISLRINSNLCIMVSLLLFLLGNNDSWERIVKEIFGVVNVATRKNN